MQVGLTSSSLATGGAHSAAVSSSTVAPTQAVRQKLPATASEYPASPLITTRPQRYSVQLNDQLTTLQQADHYLGQLGSSCSTIVTASVKAGRRRVRR